MLIKKLFPITIFFTLTYGQSLEEILNTGLKNSYKIKSYQHIINSKKYAIKQAEDEYLPTIYFYSSFQKERYKEKNSYTTYKINDTIVKYGINIKQNIYNPQIFFSIKDAKLKKEVSKLEKENFTLNLYQNILNTYFEVITNKTNLKYYELKKENYKKILENTLEKAKYKYSTSVEVSQAKSNYSIAYNDYIKAKLIYENSLKKLQLLLLTNKPIIINQSIKDSIDVIIKNSLSPYSVYEKSLIKNPTIKIASLYIKISKNELNNKKYNKYPTIDLSAGYSNENTKNIPATKHQYTISINFNLNLYNKKINDSILEAKELYLSSINNYNYQKNSLELEFNKNWNNLQTTLEIIKSDKEKINQTKEYLLKAKESYKYKLISLSDYYKAENDYFQSLINFQKDKLNLIYYYTTLLSQTNILKEKVKSFKLFLN